MPKNLTPFFATEEDLLGFLVPVIDMHPVQFVVCGLFDTPLVQSMPLLSKPDVYTNYLVADLEETIVVRPVAQKKGGEKYAVDQLANPKTIAIRTGGLVDDGCLIAGQIGTVSENKVSLDMLKLFTSEIRKRFFKIKSYYVGRQASILLDQGVRLTFSPKACPTYDLKR